MEKESEIKWMNTSLKLCVICEKPLVSNSFWACQKCSKPSEITHKHVIDDIYDIKSVCCNFDVINNQSITCSVQCHQSLVGIMIKENEGEFKIITDIHTGKTHKVPMRDIIEFGIDYSDLARYPTIQ